MRTGRLGALPLSGRLAQEDHLHFVRLIFINLAELASYTTHCGLLMQRIVWTGIWLTCCCTKAGEKALGIGGSGNGGVAALGKRLIKDQGKTSQRQTLRPKESRP
jgi:hypothetical protein